MKKINLDRKHRLKEINKLALLLQDIKLKSLKEIRNIAESIEILSDDRILNGLNSAIDDFNNGEIGYEEGREIIDRSWVGDIMQVMAIDMPFIAVKF